MWLVAPALCVSIKCGDIFGFCTHKHVPVDWRPVSCCRVSSLVRKCTYRLRGHMKPVDMMLILLLLFIKNIVCAFISDWTTDQNVRHAPNSMGEYFFFIFRLLKIQFATWWNFARNSVRQKSEMHAYETREKRCVCHKPNLIKML